MHVYTTNNILIEALKKGSPRAYTFLVETYHQKLCIYAYGLIHDHDTAEDIVQNVFLKTWTNREKLKTDLPINSYLYKSVYNEFIDQYRKQKKIFPLDKKYIDTILTFIEDDDTSFDNLIDDVKQEIQNLPKKCKETFLLSKEEGLTNIEIAEYKNVSLKTVEAHMTKAFSILRLKVGLKMNSILFLLYGGNNRALLTS
ncbi:RNA polymerase sigma factor [Polaribacter butkevichii]|uniref:RNA polymerase sigma-70 factor n=1 Tax=Polaribacter butkevichii TaxID=218490 RepID=A0A2P6CBG0_9FLAO|nr:RNA polymerase sigma-70 factor [Polaribacter butkevichii]PQJ72178.1 RNA polymerase sigma-70 factor [Polaribacter butkevichii]